MNEEQQDLLYKYGRPPVDLDQLSQQYDDGAHLLGVNPNMMPVGLFPKPKPKPKPLPVAEPPVNLQRRSIFGLGPIVPPPAQLPSVIDQIPTPSSSPPPAPLPAPAPSSSPLQQAAPIGALNKLVDKTLNEPVSRREVLKRGAKAVASQVLPIPKPTDIVSQALPEILPVAAPPPAALPPISEVIANFVTTQMGNPKLQKNIEKEIYKYKDKLVDNDEYYEEDGEWDSAFTEGGDLKSPDHGWAWINEFDKTPKTVAKNFNLEELSKQSGISIEELKKHVSDEDLQKAVSNIGNNSSHIQDIYINNVEQFNDDHEMMDLLGETMNQKYPQQYLDKAAKELNMPLTGLSKEQQAILAERASSLAYQDFRISFMKDLYGAEGIAGNATHHYDPHMQQLWDAMPSTGPEGKFEFGSPYSQKAMQGFLDGSLPYQDSVMYDNSDLKNTQKAAPALPALANPFTEAFSSPDKMEEFALNLQNSPSFKDSAFLAKGARDNAMALTNWMRTLETNPSTDPKILLNQYRSASSIGFTLAHKFFMAGDRETANKLEEALIDWFKPRLPPVPEKKLKGKK